MAAIGKPSRRMPGIWRRTPRPMLTAYPCSGDQHVEGEAEERQPLHDCRGAPRAPAAQGRHPPMSEDQDPVQNQVQRHRKQRDDHDDPGAKSRNQQEAQHRRTKEPRNAPGNRPQKTADLCHQAGFVAEAGEQRRHHHQRRHHRRAATTVATISPPPATRPAAGWYSPAPIECAASGATAVSSP